MNAGGTYEHTPDHTLNPPTVEFTCTERPIYGSSRVGMDVTQVVYTTATEALPEGQAVRLLGNKQYQVSNHLGNVLVVVSDVKVIVHDGGVITGYAAQVISATDYSPFSAALSICDSEWLAMRILSERYECKFTPLVYELESFPRVEVGEALEGRAYASGAYRFGYQAQEQDFELWEGSVNYKYRVEDPRLGRFFIVDPLLKKFAFYSPFQFASNSTIMSKELEGLESSSTGTNSTESASQETVSVQGAVDLMKELKEPSDVNYEVDGKIISPTIQSSIIEKIELHDGQYLTLTAPIIQLNPLAPTSQTVVETNSLQGTGGNKHCYDLYEKSATVNMAVNGNQVTITTIETCTTIYLSVNESNGATTYGGMAQKKTTDVTTYNITTISGGDGRTKNILIPVAHSINSQYTENNPKNSEVSIYLVDKLMDVIDHNANIHSRSQDEKDNILDDFINDLILDKVKERIYLYR